MKDERRRSDRYVWVRFESKVQVRRSLLKKEWISVEPFDFSRFGMGIQTDEAYQIGDQVALSLSFAKENAALEVPLIKGIVRYKEKHHSRFNYGVEFTFASKIEKYSMDEDLIWIENALKKYDAMCQTRGVFDGA